MSARPALTRDRIVEAAVTVADRGGLGAVSMRSVGREVGVEAMSLYHHLRGKEELLDALADWAFSRISLRARCSSPTRGRWACSSPGGTRDRPCSTTTTR